MRRNYTIYFLLISLVFNIAFLGHYVYKTVQFRNKTQSINTAPTTRQNFRVKGKQNSNKRIDPTMEEIRLKNFEHRVNFFKELAKEAPDYQKLELLADSLNITQNTLEKQMSSEDAQHFYNNLTITQKVVVRESRKTKGDQNEKILLILTMIFILSSIALYAQDGNNKTSRYHKRKQLPALESSLTCLNNKSTQWTISEQIIKKI